MKQNRRSSKTSSLFKAVAMWIVVHAALVSPVLAGFLDLRVVQGSDDAEENVSSGAVNLTSSDMELVFDGTTQQIVGLRFQDVTIPQGTTIVSAVLEFTTDETDTGSTSIVINGQDADDASTFTTTNSDLSNRTTTTASVAWSSLPAWNTVNEIHQSPDITTIVQEIIDRPGWSSGNALAILIEAAVSGCSSSACQRTAESFNGESDSAPVLRIEFDGVLAAPSTALCYAVSDSNDELKEIPLTGGSAGVPTTLGDTQVSSIEAVAYQVEHGALYGSDTDQLGRLNRTTGQFFPLSSTFGTGTATIGGSSTNVAFTDVDGLSFDPTTLVLYGSNASAGADELFVILTSTGEFLPDAFGTGEDFVEITGSGSDDIGNQVDDIAFDPDDDGQLYATDGDELYSVDKTTGTTTLVADLRVGSTTGTDILDMEGLSFDDSGQLYGTTGTSGPAATRNRLWTIDKATGVATQVGTGALGSGTDYEAVECTFTADLTYTSVTYFRVVGYPAATIVEWETAGEAATAGFYLESWDEATQRFRRLAEDPLPAVPIAPQGAVYRLADRQIQVGDSYAYRLVEWEQSGKRTIHGPFLGRVEAADLSGAGEGLATKLAQDLPYSRQARPLTPSAMDSSAVHSGVAPPSPLAAPGLRLGKITVRSTGLHALPAEDIAAALGRSVAWARRQIDRGRLLLTHRGQRVATLPAADANSLFFYGEAIDSIYTDENVYWLQPRRGLTIAEGGQPITATTSTQQTFLDKVVFEQDRLPVVAVQSDPEEGLWFWEFIVAEDPNLGSVDLPIHAESVDTSAPATLNLILLGTSPNAFGPDHHASVRLNGATIGGGTWDGTERHHLELTIDPGLLLDGDNTVTVTGLRNPGVALSVFFLDRLELTYQRRYEAVDEALHLRGGNDSLVTVEGFAAPELAVFDLQDPLQPILRSDALIEGGADGYSVRFETRSAEVPYLAVNLAAVPRATVTGWQPQALGVAGAEYVVVAPAALVPVAERLAEHRASQGLEVAVVALEDIEFAFNHGIANPRALRDFLSWARDEWHVRPRYVVLAGDGSWDYENVLGLSENLLPPLLVSTPHGLAGSDQALVDFAAANAGAPPLAIGRLPVRNAAELDRVIDKLIARDQTGGAWRRHVLLLADDPDLAGNFSADSDAIADLLGQATSVDQIHLAELPVTAARELLSTRLAEGAAMVNYIGHGGVDRMADEGLWTTADIASLANGERLPVVTALSCLSGRFDLPGFASLGEALVRAEDHGAIAFWGASLLSNNPDAATLDRAFYEAIFVSGTATLGEAVATALQTLVATGSADRTMPYTYNLLGDPAMPVP
ncbi:MAG: C25 family cysteine peptidase [Acidobacteriota bacterium]